MSILLKLRSMLPVFALLLTLVPAAPAEARLFRQSYGATVPTADGCAWNLNQDYFVPRTCETGQYGLYSACKQAKTTSPACRFDHPVYSGYCTTYGATRYRWRDHVYQSYCDCTPHSCVRGEWCNTRSCMKCPLRREGRLGNCCSTACDTKTPCHVPSAEGPLPDGQMANEHYDSGLGQGPLANVEPVEVGTLGYLQADQPLDLNSTGPNSTAPQLRQLPPSLTNGPIAPGLLLPNFGASQQNNNETRLPVTSRPRGTLEIPSRNL